MNDLFERCDLGSLWLSRDPQYVSGANVIIYSVLSRRRKRTETYLTVQVLAGPHLGLVFDVHMVHMVMGRFERI